MDWTELAEDVLIAIAALAALAAAVVAALSWLLNHPKD